MTAEAERQAIQDLWPAHGPHLPPETNRMGQPYTDTEHGIVCNCGDVLGWPEDAPAPVGPEAVKRRDDSESMADWAADRAEHGLRVTGDPEEAREVLEERHGDDVPDEVEGAAQAVVEHRYDAASDPSAMAGQDNPTYESYNGPPRPGDGEIYIDPSGVGWTSTPRNPHSDDPRFKYYAQEAPEPSGEYGDDPADETQTTSGRRSVRDVQLLAVTDDQLASADEVLQRGDREGFHRALGSAVEDATGVVSEVLGPVQEESFFAGGYLPPEEPPDFQGTLPARRADVVVAEDPIATRITIIDPSLPYGPEQVEHQLLDIAARLERGVHFQRYWEERGHNAAINFELAHARALIKATGGDAATRKAQALLECEDEYREKAVCDTMIKAIRETMHNLRSLQSGYQTMSRSVGAAMQGPSRGA